MTRDLICLIRMAIDALPSALRNNVILFQIARLVFKLPNSLYSFRQEYEAGRIKNLSILYSSDSHKSLARISKATDINSYHLKLISSLFTNLSPSSCLDVGCGSGFLLRKFLQLNPKTKLTGIDYHVPIRIKNTSAITFTEGDILENLKDLPESSFDFVSCTHVIEHVEHPEKVIIELRRVCTKCLILVFPLEKKYSWGMNYHINFFPSKKDFMDFILSIDNKNNFDPLIKTYILFGDMMYVEEYLETSES
jgi:SAM-dependent methyltransferase